MGTDRSMEYTGPCRCGAGTIEIESCSDDHAWASARSWMEQRIECAKCSRDFELQQRGRHFHYVRRSEIQNREEFSKQRYKVGKALLARPETKAKLKQLADELDAMPSDAARHRYLQSKGLVSGTAGTFRKHWKGGKYWTDAEAMSGYNLKRLYDAFAWRDQAIDDGAAEMERLDSMAKSQPPTDGPPVFSFAPRTQ